MQPLPGSVSPPDFPGVRGGITLLRSCFETLEAFWTLLMPKEDSHLNCISEKVYVQSLERFGSHSFADWRWHTLRACVKACMGLQHFRTFWDPSLFANSKDKVLMTAVAQVSSSDKFWVELQFMDELTRTLNGSRTWCSGCACHEDLRLQGKKVDCRIGGGMKLLWRRRSMILEMPKLHWQQQPFIQASYFVLLVKIQGQIEVSLPARFVAKFLRDESELAIDVVRSWNLEASWICVCFLFLTPTWCPIRSASPTLEARIGGKISVLHVRPEGSLPTPLFQIGCQYAAFLEKLVSLDGSAICPFAVVIRTKMVC